MPSEEWRPSMAEYYEPPLKPLRQPIFQYKALYVNAGDGNAARTVEVMNVDIVNLDLDDEGGIVGVEILLHETEEGMSEHYITAIDSQGAWVTLACRCGKMFNTRNGRDYAKELWDYHWKEAD